MGEGLDFAGVLIIWTLLSAILNTPIGIANIGVISTNKGTHCYFYLLFIC